MRLLLWLLIAVLALTVVPARAQDEPANAVGASASYVTPKDLEQGVGMGVTLTHVIATLLSVEFGVERYTFDDRDPGLGVVTGKVRETPLLVTAQIRPQFEWNPYLGFGAGYYLMSYDQTSEGTTLCDCELTVDNAVVVHFAAGFDVPVDDQLTLTIDVRSASGEADATSRSLSSGVSVSDQVKLDYLKIGIGLKYWF
ncbi:MAG: OmpW family outer membrane protein [Nitrospirota bacterium]